MKWSRRLLLNTDVTEIITKYAIFFMSVRTLIDIVCHGKMESDMYVKFELKFF